MNVYSLSRQAILFAGLSWPAAGLLNALAVRELTAFSNYSCQAGRLTAYIDYFPGYWFYFVSFGFIHKIRSGKPVVIQNPPHLC